MIYSKCLLWMYCKWNKPSKSKSKISEQCICWKHMIYMLFQGLQMLRRNAYCKVFVTILKIYHNLLFNFSNGIFIQMRILCTIMDIKARLVKYIVTQKYFYRRRIINCAKAINFHKANLVITRKRNEVRLSRNK